VRCSCSARLALAVFNASLAVSTRHLRPASSFLASSDKFFDCFFTKANYSLSYALAKDNPRQNASVEHAKNGD